MKTPYILTFMVGITLTATTFANESPTTKGVIDPAKLDERPPDSVTLLGPKTNQFVAKNGKPAKWKFEDGVLTIVPKTHSVITPETYQDFRMHLEFNVNERENARRAQDNGNSGVYIQKRYEVQILNSHGVPEDKYKNNYCASLYKLKKSDKNVCKPAGEWQTYDIVFRAARFDGDKKTENARITVYHNGTLIHDDFSIPRKTGSGDKEDANPGPILLQDHGNPVRFRNIWIQKLAL